MYAYIIATGKSCLVPTREPRDRPPRLLGSHDIMAFKGERFTIDLPDDEDQGQETEQPSGTGLGIGSGIIGEIKERNPTAPTPPAPKPAVSASTGFPAPKNRIKQSAFKQRRNKTASASATSPQPQAPIDDEKKSIDEENRRRLAAMSPEQIQKEREELMANLSPSLIQRLMRRANIDDEAAPAPPPSAEQKDESREEPKQDDVATATTTASPSVDATTTKSPDDFTSLDDRPPARPPPDLRPASEIPSGPIHFPRPPPRQDPMPNLDPSSPNFLSDLQSHYFPDTPHDPSALSWLQPDDEGDNPNPSPYTPGSTATSMPASAIRFSLKGTILSPSTALKLPTTLGLHHHGNDPQAAGYTIPELSILSRSTVPAQRCIAWQVLGRILFRLGRGDFGEKGTDLVEGLWAVIEKEGVVARMMDEAGAGDDLINGSSDSGKDDDEYKEAARKAGIGRHASARAWATEGIWLWRMGGGTDRGIAPRKENERSSKK